MHKSGKRRRMRPAGRTKCSSCKLIWVAFHVTFQSSPVFSKNEAAYSVTTCRIRARVAAVAIREEGYGARERSSALPFDSAVGARAAEKRCAIASTCSGDRRRKASTPPRAPRGRKRAGTPPSRGRHHERRAGWSGTTEKTRTPKERDSQVEVARVVHSRVPVLHRDDEQLRARRPRQGAPMRRTGPEAGPYPASEGAQPRKVAGDERGGRCGVDEEEGGRRWASAHCSEDIHIPCRIVNVFKQEAAANEPRVREVEACVRQAGESVQQQREAKRHA